MKSIFVVYACLLSYVHGYGQNCPPDSVGHAVYGPGCKYLCHCKDDTEQCDDEAGSCVSGCADKWMGPGCQYRDVVWGKEAIQLKGNNAYKAVDGNADTCSSSVTTGGPLWWRAWFEQPEIIRGMTIITKEANIGSFSWFKVYVEENTEQKNNTGFQRQEICYEHDGVPFLTTTITVTCVRPLRGNQIRIQLDSTQTQLVLCDVRVFGGRNLAYSKQTTQTSTQWERISSNAVDGSTNTTDPNKCTFTNYNYNYRNQWNVDLGKVVKVQALELISADQYPFGSDDVIQGGIYFNLYPTQFHSKTNTTLFFTTDSDFRYLQIKQSRGYLAICEVLVFGDCLENECGLDCNIPCHCAVFTFDNNISGVCHEGCVAGWTGEGHKCDTECAPGRYGLGCLELCTGHCGNNIACDNVRGHCPQGCAAGWMGEMCDEECSDGTYGSDCSNSCSNNCLGRGPCDKENGLCRNGCKPGWKGDTCHTECLDGKYGNMCYYNCSGNCLHGRLCNKTNGDCDDGCSPGWRENMCNFKCYSWYYGNGCGERCSYHCFNNDICDNVDGNCPRGCAAGWIGLKCDTECSDGSYGVNCSEKCSLHCKDERMCDKTNGRCVGGCKAGWQGLTCLTECSNGTFGMGCSHNCSGQCVDGETCNKTNGHCDGGCVAGWQGNLCDIECSNGSYGVNCRKKCSLHCKEERMCDKTNGTCVGGCKGGWQGLTCLTECVPGSYGLGCTELCNGHCVNNIACDNVLGHCPQGCAAGWKGDKCDKEINCPVHTFGLDCTPCGPCKNGSCDPVTGECPSGCYDGYVGSMCETFNYDCMYTVNAGLVGAGVGIVITLLVVAVIVAVLWKVKQRPHIYEEPLTMTSSGPINEPVYDTCQDQ